MHDYSRDIAEWMKAGVIDEHTAARIESFQHQKREKGKNVSIVVFSVLGAVLVGLGISLMVAQNWDTLPKYVKTILGFIPLLLGQFFSLLAIFKYKYSKVWAETAGAFWFLTLGASLAIIAQTYQLQGSLAGFMLLWLICASPIMFILKSRSVLLLYLLLATWYSLLAVGHSDAAVSPLHYWWMFGLSMLFALLNIKNNAEERIFGAIFGWVLSICLTISLFTVAGHNNSTQWMFFAYFAMFQCMLFLYLYPPFKEPPSWQNGFGFTGTLGIVFLLFFFSYHSTIKTLLGSGLDMGRNFWGSSESIAFFILNIIYILLAVVNKKAISFVTLLYPIFCVIALLSGINVYWGVFANNMLILLMGSILFLRGAKMVNLLWLNGGMLIISMLIILRFFDFNISFFVRGIAFLFLGAGFFIANRMILLKREKEQLNEK